VNEQRVIGRNLRAFYGRVIVMPSPVDESETAGGVIVPIQYAGSDAFERGVVQHAAPEPSGLGAENLEPGTVVYYRCGVRIHDVVVVDLADVLAYEVLS